MRGVRAMAGRAEQEPSPSVHGGQTTARVANGQSAELPIRRDLPQRGPILKSHSALCLAGGHDDSPYFMS
jgi:hypothetical protein